MPRVLLFTSLLLLLVTQSPVLAQPSAPPDPVNVHTAPADTERLVVFEGFLRPTCSICQAAAPQIDQLAADYAGQPVVFLEQNVDWSLGRRIHRWWAATDQTSVTLPLAMVDSGYEISNGYVDFYTVYKGMVDAALSRPPQADVTAYMKRDGDTMAFSVLVTNRSGQELGYHNAATVHALLYEEGGDRGKTRRFVIAAPYAALGGDTALPDGATGTFSMTIGSLVDVDWHNVHGVALVDYRPAGSSGPYNALQAAVAYPLGIAPETMSFWVEPLATTVEPQQIDLDAPDHLTWTLTRSADWVTLGATSGSMTQMPELSVDPAQLAAGRQDTAVTLSFLDAGRIVWTQEIPVTAYYGTLHQVRIPLAMKVQ